MIRSLRKILATAALLSVGTAVPALAQAMPTPQQIQEQVRQQIDKLPTATAEGAFITIEYKQLPTDPVEFAKRTAGGQIPAGMDPNVIAKQALPFVTPVIEKEATSVGTLKVAREVKLGSKKLSPDQTYTFGLAMSGMNPLGITVSGGDLKKPIVVKFKRGKQDPKTDPMAIEIVADPKKPDEQATIHVKWGETLGAAGPAKAAAAK